MGRDILRLDGRVDWLLPLEEGMEITIHDAGGVDLNRELSVGTLVDEENFTGLFDNLKAFQFHQAKAGKT